MMDALQQYIALLGENRDCELTDEQLQWIGERYPYFVLPFATAASHERSPERRAKLMERVALMSTDREMLLRMVDPDGHLFARFYPDADAPSTPDTDSAIDTFLATYGNRNPREDALLERLIFNPVADYSAVLEREAAEAGATSATDGQDAVLDAFLASQGMIETAEEKVPDAGPAKAVTSPAVDSSLNESLAKIYIKQHRYSKAYEIIEQLSLNFPEKSIYFADQMRFLKKLMRNQELLAKQN